MRELVESVREILEEEKVDAKQIIKDLAKSYGDSNESQGKMVQLLRGLAFSDDPEANKFMKALDKWTTEYSNRMNEALEIDEASETFFVMNPMKPNSKDRMFDREKDAVAWAKKVSGKVYYYPAGSRNKKVVADFYRQNPKTN